MARSEGLVEDRRSDPIEPGTPIPRAGSCEASCTIPMYVATRRGAAVKIHLLTSERCAGQLLRVQTVRTFLRIVLTDGQSTGTPFILGGEFAAESRQILERKEARLKRNSTTRSFHRRFQLAPTCNSSFILSPATIAKYTFVLAVSPFYKPATTTATVRRSLCTERVCVFCRCIDQS